MSVLTIKQSQDLKLMGDIFSFFFAPHEQMSNSLLFNKVTLLYLIFATFIITVLAIHVSIPREYCGIFSAVVRGSTVAGTSLVLH